MFGIQMKLFVWKVLVLARNADCCICNNRILEILTTHLSILMLQLDRDFVYVRKKS